MIYVEYCFFLEQLKGTITEVQLLVNSSAHIKHNIPNMKILGKNTGNNLMITIMLIKIEFAVKCIMVKIISRGFKKASATDLIKP